MPIFVTRRPRHHVLRKSAQVPYHFSSRQPILRNANGNEFPAPRQKFNTSTRTAPSLICHFHLPRTHAMAEVLPSSPKATTDPVLCSTPRQQEHHHLPGPGDQDPALSSSPVGNSLPRTSTPESSHHVRPSSFQTRDPVQPRSTPPPPVHIGNHSVAAGAPADRGPVVSAQKMFLSSGLQHVDLLQQPNNVMSPIDNSPQDRPHQLGSRVKRFSYSPACDLLILKAVTTTGAHLANHGKTTVKFQETVAIMSQASSVSQVEGVKSLTWKSVRDRFKKLLPIEEKITKEISTHPELLKNGERKKYSWMICCYKLTNMKRPSALKKRKNAEGSKSCWKQADQYAIKR